MEEVYEKVGRVDDPRPNPYERLPNGNKSNAEMLWRSRNKGSYRKWVESLPGNVK